MSLGEAVVEVGADTSGFASGLEKDVKKAAGKAESALSKIGRGTTKAGRNLTLGITAPLVALATQAVKTQGSFEQSMNLLGVNAQIGGRELQKMGDLAKQMGADTVFSAVEAADAMLELSKGGFKSAEIAGGGIQSTMALAATEGLALADSAVIVGNAMNTFGLKAENASRIADALAAGSVASSASVASLAEGLGNVGPIAQASGLSLEEVVTTLAQLDQAGIKGAEGGTALRSFLTQLTPTSKKAKDEIKRLGLEFQNADGDFRSLGDIAQQLQDKLGGLTDAQKAETLQTIFGRYAKQAAAVMLQDGAEGYEKFRAEVERTGTAQELADARMKGTTGALEQMSGSVETAGLALGEALAPTVVTVAGKIQKLANWFSELDEGTQQTIVTVGAFVAVTGPALLVLGKMITAASAVAGAWTKMSTAMMVAETRTKVLGGALRTVAGAGGLFLLSRGMNETNRTAKVFQETLGGAAMGSVFGPWGAAIGGAVGLLHGLTSATKGAKDEARDSLGTWREYKDTLNAVSGATTAATREMVGLKLEESGALKRTRAAGLADREVINAIVKGGKARERVTAALIKEKTALDDNIGAKKRELAANVAIATDNSIDLATQTKAANEAKANRATLADLENLRAERRKLIDTTLADIGVVDQSVIAKRREIAAYREFSAAIKDLPKDVRVAVRTQGLQPGIDGIVSLARQIDLTPKDIEILLRENNLQPTLANIKKVQDKADALDATAPVITVDANVDPALAALQRLVAKNWSTVVNVLPFVNAPRVSGKPKDLEERATGGPVSANALYLIGERGPELFVPSTSGRIISNQESRNVGRNNPFSELPLKKLNRALDEHKGKLRELRDAYQDIATSVSDAFQPDMFSGGLGQLIGSQTTALGTLPGISAAIKRLTDLGVSPGFLSQLIASGNTSLIAALGSGTAAQAKQVGANFDRIQALTGQIGNQAAAISPEARELVKVQQELAMIRKLLAKQPKRQGEETSKALNKTAAGAKRRRRRPGP